MDYFEKVKGYLLELEFDIVMEDLEEQLVVVNKEDEGILNMVIDCEDPILIIEQFLFEIKSDDPAVLKSLLQKNREVIHGAFAIDENGTKVLFRDTLQLENLDLNELEGSINSLSLLISEYYEELLAFAKA